MKQLSQSPFLYALGNALLNSLWQFALLWFIYFAVYSLGRFTSNHKYRFAFALQLSGFGWFAYTLYSFYIKNLHQFSEITVRENHFSFIVKSNEPVVNYKLHEWIKQAELLLPYLSIVYITLLLFYGLKWLQAYKNTQLVRTKGLEKAEESLALFVQQFSRQLDIRRSVSIYLSSFIQTPLTIGFFKPVILVPLASLNHLTTEQMEAVLLHELAHIKRNDYLFNLCLALIEVVLFFNPFLHLLSRHIKNERENCCDDQVLQYEYNAASYAHALLTIASFHSSLPSMALKATDNQHVLLNRIKRIIERKDHSFFQYGHQFLFWVTITIIFSSLSFFSPATKTERADILHFNTSSNIYAVTKNKSVHFLTIPRSEKLFPKFDKSVKDNLKQENIVLNNSAPKNLHELAKKKNITLPTLPKTPFPPAVGAISVDDPNEILQIAEDNIETVGFETSEIPVPLPPLKELQVKEKQVKMLLTLLLKQKIILTANQWDKKETQTNLEKAVKKWKLQFDKICTIKPVELEPVNNQRISIAINLNTRQEKLNLLIAQIKDAIEEAKEENEINTSNIADQVFNFQMPAKDNAMQAQSWNNVLPGKPQKEILKVRKTKKKIAGENKNDRVIIIKNDNDETNSEEMPEAPEKPSEIKFSVFNNIRTIRI